MAEKNITKRKIIIKKGKNKSKAGMISSEFFKQWLSAFAAKVDPIIMEKYVTAKGCYPWHIFTWGKVECIRKSGNYCVQTH